MQLAVPPHRSANAQPHSPQAKGQLSRRLLARASAVLAHVLQEVFLLPEVDAALDAREHSWPRLRALVGAGCSPATSSRSSHKQGLVRT